MAKKIYKILIVEDDLSLKPFWDSVLDKIEKKMEIDWAVSSEEAQKVVEQRLVQGKSFDLIIADLFLAGSKTGMDFLTSKEVKSSDSKTILVSLAEQKSLESECKKILPKTKIIVKPLSAARCEKVVRQLIN